MNIKLKIILLLVIFNLSYTSYSSAFCNVIGADSKENLERAEKDPSKKRTCTFSKIGKKLFGEVGETLGIAIDVGVNGNRIVNKKPKKNTKYKDTELEIDSKYTGKKNNSKQKKETNKLNKNK